jgi:predicted transglutaminase-like cysteine proteinase
LEAVMTRSFWAAAAAIAVLAAPAEAASHLPVAGAAAPLPAWISFCTQEPAECAVDQAEPAQIPLNRETVELIEAVNRHVNRTLTPITDLAHWQLVDRWNIPSDGAGDCEDYQLLKRKLLVEAGLPRRALRMTVVLNSQGEGHAVLMVRTTQGDFILDNLRPTVLAWNQTGYRFVKRESDTELGWVYFTPVPAQDAAAEVSALFH